MTMSNLVIDRDLTRIIPLLHLLYHVRVGLAGPVCTLWHIRRVVGSGETISVDHLVQGDCTKGILFDNVHHMPSLEQILQNRYGIANPNKIHRCVYIS